MESNMGFEVQMKTSYEQALENVKAALKSEGFGVLTSVDMQATMKEKLGVDFHRYAILGACNPPLANKALNSDSTVGLMLPCNVIVEEFEGGSRVILANPQAMMLTGQWASNPALCEVADEATARCSAWPKTCRKISYSTCKRWSGPEQNMGRSIFLRSS